MTRLKYERRARRLSQVRLARETQLNQPDLSLIERGILIPTPAQLERLSHALSVPSGDLLKEVVFVQAAS